MIKTNNQTQWISRLAILVGVIGMSSLAGLPALAQTGTNQSASSEAKVKVLAQSSMSTKSKNLVQLAKETNSFNTLLQAGQAAGLLDTLASKGPYTVFAPTDAAFAALPQGAVAAALQPQNKELLRQVLLYHVVPGRVTSSQLQTGSVKTLGGGVSVRVGGGKVIVNNASVTRANVEASNGVAHVINRVLLPPQIRQQLAAQLTTQ